MNPLAWRNGKWNKKIAASDEFRFKKAKPFYMEIKS